jgi:hypothetical protein
MELFRGEFKHGLYSQILIFHEFHNLLCSSLILSDQQISLLQTNRSFKYKIYGETQMTIAVQSRRSSRFKNCC